MLSSSLANFAREGFAFLAGVPAAQLSIDSAKITKYADVFTQVEKETGVSRHFLAALAWTESGFRADVVNSIGATGLMQVMPMNFKAYGMTANPKDPYLNVRGGAKDLLAKGWGRKPLETVMRGYNGLIIGNNTPEVDAQQLREFHLYYRRILARWAYITTLNLF